MEKGKSSTFIYFDAFCISLFLIILIWSAIDYYMVPVLTPVLLLFFSFAFLFSNKLKELSYVEKALYWFSHNVFLPRTDYNYLIVGFFLMIMSGLAAASYLSSVDVEDDRLLWEMTVKDPTFWILIFIVLAFNLLIGLYRYKKKKSD